MNEGGASSNNNRLRKRVSFSVNEAQGAASNSSRLSHQTISPIDEQFISQIVLTPTALEQPLANVLKSVFAAGRAEAFRETLEVWAAKKEQEIEAACAEGYGLYVPTVDTVLGRIREIGGVLEGRMTSLKEELASSAQQIYDTKHERFEARKMLLNVGKTIFALEEGLRALNLLQSATFEIKDGNFQEAVKLIDELQGKGALRACEDMPFHEGLLSGLEAAKRRVWDAATGQVKDWLSTVREHSALMGSLALSQLQTRYEQYQREIDTNKEYETPLPFELFLMETAAEDSAMITANDLVKIDFTPLQRVLRLFASMDRKGELMSLLVDTRRIQLELILGSRVSLELPDTDPKSLRAFLNALTGFFIFERLLARLPLAIYPQSNADARWEAAQNRIREIALNSLKLSASDRAAFMKIKWQYVFFTHCLDLFGFPINPLLETILTLFYRYVDLLRQDCIERAQLAILKDPLTGSVNISSDISSSLQESLAAGHISISPCVWECFTLIRGSFLSSFHVFLEGVPTCTNRSADFAMLARKTVDDHILPSICRTLLDRLKFGSEESAADSNSIPLTSSQKVRLLQALALLRDMCTAQGDLVHLISGVCERSQIPQIMTLNSAKTFEEALSVAQLQAGKDVAEEVDKFLTKLVYDRNPKSKTAAPSPAIQDLIRFFKGLGSIYIKDFWIYIFKHISSFFDSRVLADVKYPHINALFFQNVAIDLNALKEFLLDTFDASEKTSELFAALAPPIEICTLMAAESVHEFLDPVVRRRKYAHLGSQQIISVLSRVKEPADKRQSVEDLILLLK